MSANTDRRRVNGPPGGTSPPILERPPTQSLPIRRRGPSELRKTFLKTGLTPSASGSAYFELEQPTSTLPFPQTLPTTKLSCTVHGPRPLPSSAPFSSILVLSTYVKFATSATARRHGYLRDAVERDLTAHLKAALRGVVIAEQWPKSCVEVVVTVLEAEGDSADGYGTKWPSDGGLATMSLLSGSITVASAALLDAGIDCVGVIAGGAAALIYPAAGPEKPTDGAADLQVITDPCPNEHTRVALTCVVGCLGSRHEVSEVWLAGGFRSSIPAATVGHEETEALVNSAVAAAVATHPLILKAVRV